MGAKHAPAHERLWRHVEKTEGCWFWTAGTDTGGYGQIAINGRLIRVHRFSYELAYGAIPKGMLICHRCDTRRCVRPDHLFAGTSADNMTDMVVKGRSAKGDASTSRLYPELRRRGEQHPKAKLTDDDIRTIRTEYRPAVSTRPRSPNSQRGLADRYGVSRNVIQSIIDGVTWRHVV